MEKRGGSVCEWARMAIQRLARPSEEGRDVHESKRILPALPRPKLSRDNSEMEHQDTHTAEEQEASGCQCV